MAAAWSPDRIRSAVRLGTIAPLRRGAFRTAGAPITQEMVWMAAVLAAGPGVVLGGLSAAQAFGFRRFPVPDSIHLLTTMPHQPRMPGVVGHRTISLPDYDLTHVRSIPTTTAERTFIDGCGAVSAKVLGRSGDDLLRRQVLRLPRLVKSFELIPVSGRRKRRPMYGFFEERVQGYNPGGSDEELDVMRIIKAAGLPLPTQQFRVRIGGRTYFLDYAYPDARQGMEWDSYEYHGRYVSDFHDDKHRKRDLIRLGWTIWPITSQTSANEILAIAAGACEHKLAS